jgi:hypothetical protein
VGDDETATSLLAWLADQGYETTAEVADERAGGNRTNRLARGACQVTVSRDRGQWYVEAGLPDHAGFDMNIWDAFLSEQLPPSDPLPFADEVRLLRSALFEIELVLALDDDAVARLGSLQSWVQETRWSSHAF